MATLDRFQDGLPRPAGPGPNIFPHLVVRIYAAVYQREIIDFRVGPSCVEIKHKGTYVQCPQPFIEGREVSAECRALLLNGVKRLVDRPRGFRMCLVWAKDKCTYVEKGGVFNESDDPPKGGLEIPGALEIGDDVQYTRL